MPLSLFFEEIWDIKKQIVEDEAKTKKDFYIVSENAIQCNVLNQNNRIYPKHVVEKDLNRYIAKILRNGRAWGELGHPPTPKIIEQNISHRFIEIKENGNYYAVKAKVLNTPNGEIVKALIEDNEGKMGISTRALGSTVSNNDGHQVVQEDLYFVTMGDIVADPSAQSAFIHGVLEGKQWDWKDGCLIECIEEIKQEIEEDYKINMSVEEKQRIILDGFKNLKKRINLNEELQDTDKLPNGIDIKDIKKYFPLVTNSIYDTYNKGFKFTTKNMLIKKEQIEYLYKIKDKIQFIRCKPEIVFKGD